ncbi:MAG TPA: hypothetical protein VFP84_03875 [Kofleriaceae bacterium]|nr:hypothetical protein [Kofleriaceae bacterium]
MQALPLVGADELGDPSWEAAVWARIARQAYARPRMRWFWGSMAMTASLVILASWLVLGDRDAGRSEADDAPVIEVMPGPVAMRSLASARPRTAAVGDQIRITVKQGGEIRVYRDHALVLACPPGTTSGDCVSDERGLVAVAKLPVPGTYALVVITPDPARVPALGGAPKPAGGLTKDLTALSELGCNYQLTQLRVR